MNTYKFYISKEVDNRKIIWRRQDGMLSALVTLRERDLFLDTLIIED